MLCVALRITWNLHNYKAKLLKNYYIYAQLIQRNAPL